MDFRQSRQSVNELSGRPAALRSSFGISECQVRVDSTR
jgi:hypothetical protein